MKTLETRLAEAEALIATLTAENKTMKESVTASKKAAAQAELGRLVQEAKLPKPAVDRLTKHFETAESTDGMKETVMAEAEYIKSLAPTPKNNGVGDNAHQESTTAAKDALKKTLKESGYSDAEVAIMAE